MQNDELADDISGRMGLDQNAYLEICRDALAQSEEVESMMKTCIRLSEISNTSSGNIRIDRAGQSNSKIRVAMINIP